ncbi:MAG: hypothetical protein ACEPOZ_21235 [Marinifilaceae bacterium]
MEKESKIYAFIKAIEKPYFNSFINEGQICMSTAKWFREYEGIDDNIGDAGEGAITSCGNGFTVSFADPIDNYSSEEELKEKLKKSQWSKPLSGVNLRMFDRNNANILSLYAITALDINGKAHKHLVPKKFIDEFSNHRFVLILNPKNFIERIANTLNRLNKSPIGGMVKYYPLDNKMRSNLTFFHKQERYSYQHEYRLIFQDENPEKKIINIGALDDICMEIDLNRHCYVKTIDNIELTIIRDDKYIIEEKTRHNSGS